MQLLDNQAADGTGTEYALESVLQQFHVYVRGGFDGGTVNIEVSPDGGTNWYTAKSYTAEGNDVIEVQSDRIRASLTGTAGGAASIYAEAFGADLEPTITDR